MYFKDRDYRNALARYTTGVTVVTAAGQDGAGVGITVNSFSSISLDPPLISWSLGRDSKRFELFGNADNFAVNVLAHEQEVLAKTMAETTNLDSAAPWEPAKNGAPWILGAVTRLACETYKRVEAGDHVIIIGQVVDYDHRDKPALTYYRSNYGRAESL